MDAVRDEVFRVLGWELIECKMQKEKCKMKTPNLISAG